jgi:hypothetical protein
VADLISRVDALETAVLALARTEFGDSPGHDFHGNQWTEATHAYDSARALGVGHKDALKIVSKGYGKKMASALEKSDHVAKNYMKSSERGFLPTGGGDRSTPVQRQINDATRAARSAQDERAAARAAGKSTTMVDGKWLIDGKPQEFGDTEGHPFHGNQWSSGSAENVALDRGKKSEPADLQESHALGVKEASKARLAGAAVSDLEELAQSHVDRAQTLLDLGKSQQSRHASSVGNGVTDYIDAIQSRVMSQDEIDRASPFKNGPYDRGS